MAILTNTIPLAARVPVTGDNVGGGLIAAIFIGAGGDSTNYGMEHSFDGGTTWGLITDEAGNALVLVYTAKNLFQVNPPVRAPLFRLKGDDADEADAILTYKVHTV